MRTILAGLAALTLIASCASAPDPLAPVGNVGSGEAARARAADAHQCTIPESQQCECERAVIASGMSAETARQACTQ